MSITLEGESRPAKCPRMAPTFLWAVAPRLQSLYFLKCFTFLGQPPDMEDLADLGAFMQKLMRRCGDSCRADGGAGVSTLNEPP